MSIDLMGVQIEVGNWADTNFPNGRSIEKLLGVMEEVGELCHAYLKRTQGIRISEDHDENIKDAVGDIVIYLLNFCYLEGISLEQSITETWDKVRQRDWVQNPSKGSVQVIDINEGVIALTYKTDMPLDGFLVDYARKEFGVKGKLLRIDRTSNDFRLTFEEDPYEGKG